MPIKASFSEVRAALAALGEAERAALVAELAPRPVAPWQARQWRLDARDAAVRAAAARFYPTERLTRQARLIADDLRRYAAAGWLRDRVLAELPDGSSPQRRAFFSILRAGGSIGWRQINNILAGAR